MLLMDTCAFLWFFHNDDRLSEQVKDTLETSRDLYISIASLWEIAIKKALGKLAMDESITDLENVCNENSITILPIKICYLEELLGLPEIHKDPFDRLIIATAKTEKLSIVTDDKKIPLYGMNVLW